MTDNEERSKLFQIRFRIGDVEAEVRGSDPDWVDLKAEELKGWLFEDHAVSQPSGEPEVPHGAARKTPSLTEHVRAVDPQNGLEYVLAVGYYLERYSRLKNGFRRRDIAEAFKVLGYHHSNPGVPIGAGRRQGLLMDGEEHEKVQLTESGERWVEEKAAR